MKAGSVSPRVLRILAQIQEGALTNAEIASAEGITASAIKDIRRRYGCRQRIGRPTLVAPLTEQQQALVEAHMRYARGVARRCCREKSRAYSFDEPDYISCAYVGLVKAASRWRWRGSFKALVAKYVEGSVRDLRRADMLAHGWSWETGARLKMVQVAKLASWPRYRKSGQEITKRLPSVGFGENAVSSVQLLSEAFGNSRVPPPAPR